MYGTKCLSKRDAQIVWPRACSISMGFSGFMVGGLGFAWARAISMQGAVGMPWGPSTSTEALQGITWFMV